MKIGSITPSSSYLTKRMLEDLPWQYIESIVELGAGTGVFTDYIARSKRKSCQVVIVEQDCPMRQALQIRHPRFIYGSEAENLICLLNNANLPKVDCIISGLPFALFPMEMQIEIMHAVVVALKQDGIFRAYQYSLHMRKALEYYFAEVTTTLEPLNIPPAFVYCCRSPHNFIDKG